MAKDCKVKSTSKWIPRSSSTSKSTSKNISWKKTPTKTMQINTITIKAVKADINIRIPEHKTLGSAGMDLYINEDIII